MSTSFSSPPSNQWYSGSKTRVSLTAFKAILGRDLLVIRREAHIFLLQTLIQPIFFLFVFGKVLSTIGAANAGFSTLLLPGIVAFTVFLTAFQGPATDLARDLGVMREIDDRLLAPLPVTLVGVEKVLLAVLRALISGTLIFPLAYLILGEGYQVRSDLLGLLAGLMVLTALVGASLGLMLGSAIPMQLLPILFALVLTPLIFTGCTYYPWSALSSIKWFQIITLFNPLTYASEGIRYALVPPVAGQKLETLPLGWVVVVLCLASVVFLWLGIKLFKRRVVS